MLASRWWGPVPAGVARENTDPSLHNHQAEFCGQPRKPGENPELQVKTPQLPSRGTQSRPTEDMSRLLTTVPQWQKRHAPSALFWKLCVSAAPYSFYKKPHGGRSSCIVQTITWLSSSLDERNNRLRTRASYFVKIYLKVNTYFLSVIYRGS